MMMMMMMMVTISYSDRSKVRMVRESSVKSLLNSKSAVRRTASISSPSLYSLYTWSKHRDTRLPMTSAKSWRSFFKILWTILLLVSHKYSIYIMYEINYNGQTSYVSNNFYCCIRPEGLLCDAERYLSAIAVFLVSYAPAKTKTNPACLVQTQILCHTHHWITNYR